MLRLLPPRPARTPLRKSSVKKAGWLNLGKCWKGFANQWAEAPDSDILMPQDDAPAWS